MRIVLLASARRDLEWFKSYYEAVFPQGARRAADRYLRTIRMLRDNPNVGHPMEGGQLRALTVLRTPFILMYRIADDQIEIVRVKDGRSAGNE